MASIIHRLKGNGIPIRFPSPFSFGRARMLSAISSISSSINSADESLSSPSRILMSPGLMLPPKAGDHDNMVYKLYNLAEDRVESFNNNGVNFNEEDFVLVGSSHGWLAFFNQRNNHVFISNPLSGRHIKLPPIHTLPNPEFNLRDGRGTVSKLILSCSPDDQDEECRAMMAFGPGDRLAFCFPGRSPAHWTPIGDLFFESKKYSSEDTPSFLYGRAYEDFVYCSSRKLFSCITEFRIYLEDWEPFSPTELEEWDLGDPPRSRTCDWLPRLKFEVDIFSWFQDHYKFLLSCIQIPYLVEHNHQLFIVTRFVNADPYKTFGFCVLKVNYDGNGLVDNLTLADSLDGLAMFVGINHSFAVSSAAELGLNPDSIYFTDNANSRLTDPSDVRSAHHGCRPLDIGIFDYGNKTLSPCPPYYNHFSHDDQTLSTPVWFTPSR